MTQRELTPADAGAFGSVRTTQTAAATAETPHQTVAVGALALALATLTLPVALLLPAPLVPPTVSAAAVVLAAFVAAAAWLLVRRPDPTRLTLWDAAGILALLGVGAGIVGEPHAVVEIATQGNSITVAGTR